MRSGQLHGPQDVDARKSPDLWRVTVTRQIFEQRVSWGRLTGGRTGAADQGCRARSRRHGPAAHDHAASSPLPQRPPPPLRHPVALLRSPPPYVRRPTGHRPSWTGTVQAPASRRTSGAVTSGADSSVQSAACGQPRRAVGRGATASTPCGRSGPRLARPSPSRDVRVRAGPRRRAAAGGPATARTPISPHAAGAGTRRAPAGPRPGAPAVAHGLRAARVSRS